MKLTNTELYGRSENISVFLLDNAIHWMNLLKNINFCYSGKFIFCRSLISLDCYCRSLITLDCYCRSLISLDCYCRSLTSLDCYCRSLISLDCCTQLATDTVDLEGIATKRLDFKNYIFYSTKVPDT